jgi:hypothetical protein
VTESEGRSSHELQLAVLGKKQPATLTNCAATSLPPSASAGLLGSPKTYTFIPAGANHSPLSAWGGRLSEAHDGVQPWVMVRLPRQDLDVPHLCNGDDDALRERQRRLSHQDGERLMGAGHHAQWRLGNCDQELQAGAQGPLSTGAGRREVKCA